MGFTVKVGFAKRIQLRQYEPVELAGEVAWEVDADTENLDEFKAMVEGSIVRGFEVIMPQVSQLIEEMRPGKQAAEVGGDLEVADIPQTFPGAELEKEEAFEKASGFDGSAPDLTPAEQRSKKLWNLVYAAYETAGTKGVFIRGKHLGLTDPAHAAQLFAGPGAPELNEAKKLVWARFNSEYRDLTDSQGKKIATANKSWPADVADKEIAFWAGLLDRLKSA